MLAIDSKLKGWTVRKALGSGAYGLVVVVEKDGIEAALKQTRDPRALFSFRVEQQILQQLSVGGGRNFVPTLLDSSFEGPQSFQHPFLVMSLEDESLQSVIDRQRNNYMSRHQTIMTGYCVGNALKYLHGLGYVHQDIKPDNVLVSRSAGKAKLLLTDFGVAANVTQTGVTTGITVNTGYLYNDYRLMSGSRYTFVDDLGSLCYLMLGMRKESRVFRGDCEDRKENRRKLEEGETKLSGKNSELQPMVCWVFRQDRRDSYDMPKLPPHDEFIAMMRSSPHFATV